jgi:NitT/TauT family transport system ATP-binding protein
MPSSTETHSAPHPSTSSLGVPVRVSDVTRLFPGPVLTVDRVNLSVPAGQFVSFLGPSGCGKSTLLRLIASLDRPTSGSVEIGRAAVASTGAKSSHIASSEIDSRTSPIAFVFQDAHLLPWRSVLRNVALPLELSGLDKTARLQAALDALNEVGLSDAADRYPAQLSGGMRMRVSLARALVTRPRLLLLDEPFAALDELTRQRLDEKLYQLWQAHGMTVLFVTHSISEALYLSQRVVVFSPRPARIVADRTIDLPIERPVSLRTEPSFAAQARLLHEDLVRGGAA